MQINPNQLFNPGVLDLDQKRREKLDSYKKMVGVVKCLNENEKKQWIILGYLLTASQLEEAEKILINENLRILKVRGELERIKPMST